MNFRLPLHPSYAFSVTRSAVRTVSQANVPALSPISGRCRLSHNADYSTDSQRSLDAREAVAEESPSDEGR